MKCPTQVNCHRHRHTQGAKHADRLWPKSAMQSAAPPHAWSMRTFQTAGVLSKPKLISLFMGPELLS